MDLGGTALHIFFWNFLWISSYFKRTRTNKVKMKVETKTFSDKWKPKEFSSRSTSQEMQKKVLQGQRKWYSTEMGIYTKGNRGPEIIITSTHRKDYFLLFLISLKDNFSVTGKTLVMFVGLIRHVEVKCTVQCRTPTAKQGSSKYTQ